MAFATTAPAEAATPTPQSAYLATHLRTNPIYVTDQLPREIPHSTAPAFAKLAKRTGVPTYVLVLPDQPGTGTRLLGAVHDRLGRNGLYVLISDMGVVDASAFGVRVPAEDAETVALFELPYDAGPLLSFERFTDVIAQGSAKAAQRADAAREKYAGDAYDSGEDPPELYISSTDRDNQSFLTGILLVGVPLLILLLVPFVWRRLPGQPKRRPWIAPSLALLSAAAIALTTSLTFDQTNSSAAPPPTAADLSARTNRVAAGLKQDAVYADPESPRVLDDVQLSQLHSRIDKFERSRGPVYVSLVPRLHEDESGGDTDAFASAVHAKLGKDGVYVVADPILGDIDVVNYGLRLDDSRLLFDLPDSIRYGDDDAVGGSGDHHLGKRLDQLMTFLGESPRTDEAGSPDSDRAPDPVEDNTLHPLFAGDFWPGLMMGALTGLLVFGAVAAVTAIVAGVRRRRDPAPASSAGRPFEAPTDPSLSYLRRTARTELGALSVEFTDSAATTSATTSASGIRAWDCFDAAMLLVDGEIDALGEATDDPGRLVAVIVLARAGRAALTGETYDLCCGLNPLHGPAAGRHDVRLSNGSRGPRRRRGWLPVCERCRNTGVVDPGDVQALRLTLPHGSDDRGTDRVPYEDVPGPLPAARRGIPQLIDQVREYVSVQ